MGVPQSEPVREPFRADLSRRVGEEGSARFLDWIVERGCGVLSAANGVEGLGGGRSGVEGREVMQVPELGCTRPDPAQIKPDPD